MGNVVMSDILTNLNELVIAMRSDGSLVLHKYVKILKMSVTPKENDLTTFRKLDLWGILILSILSIRPTYWHQSYYVSPTVKGYLTSDLRSTTNFTVSFFLTWFGLMFTSASAVLLDLPIGMLTLASMIGYCFTPLYFVAIIVRELAVIFKREAYLKGFRFLSLILLTLAALSGVHMLQRYLYDIVP